MRPASTRVVTLWITVLCLLTALFTLNVSAQTVAKRKLSKQASAAKVAVAKASAKTTPAMRHGAPPPLTTDTWNGTAGDGQWTTAGNWSAGVPTSSDAVTIGTTSAAVTLANNQTGSFGTLTLSNSGDSLTVDNNANLDASGNISNAGTITLSGTGNGTGLVLENSLTLSGAGTVNLNSTNGQYTGLIDGASGSVLTTSSNITGAGTVGNGQINLVNSGTINANISGQTLNVNPDTCSTCTNTNTGTLEATGGATLQLDAGNWTQTGAGKITAAASSTVNLMNSFNLTGGTLSTTGSGVINDANNQDISLTNVTNTGNYMVQNNALTETSGTLTNSGTITLNAGGNGTGLYLNGNTTLSGSGTVVMTSSNNQWTAEITGVAGTVLTNQSTITGWGTIGQGAVEVSNASNGVINSNISGGNIELNPYTSVASSNAGLMEATNGGTLTMTTGTWNNTGTIQAASGSSVVLVGNVNITGGTIESTGTGTVIDAANNDAFLNGLTLAGTYDIQNNAATEITGTITNNGVINLQATGNGTGIYVLSGSATLAGSGSIVLGTGAGNQFWGAGGTSLTIDQNVSGVGNIGLGGLTLTNNSTIDANISPTVSTAPLYIQAGAGGMANNGTLEATNGGDLTITGNTITNGAHGLIEAVGSDSSSNPSTVVLTANTTIVGGTLTTTGAGVIQVAQNNTANLTNLTVSTGSVVNVGNNGEILSTGTITNNGTITLQGGGNSTYFYSPNATTLTGTGTLVLSSTDNQYTGNIDLPGGLINDETITGAGTIDNGIFTNNGTINANVSGQSLTLQSMAAGTANTKTMEATNGGTMVFNGSSWNNAGGTITAQTGSSVDLTGDVTITGGILNSVGTGQVFVAANNIAILTGLTNSGTLNVQNNGEIQSSGTITNNGTITLQAGGNQTYFYSPTATVLSGTGTLVMTSTDGQYTANVDTAGGLTNDETITGAGQIEGGEFINNGTVNANISGQNLTLQSLAAGTANTKTLEASGGGTMTFSGSTWTNTGGVIEAEAGSAVDLTGSVTITGGTLTSSGTGAVNVMANNNVFLVGLTNSGTLNAQNNSQLSFTGAMTNTGTVNISSTGNNTYLIINGAVTLSGSGVIDLNGSCNTCDIIYGEGTAPQLTSSNTIEGAGLIGQGNLGFTNNGTLNANIAGQNLTIEVDSLGFTNYNGTTTTLTGGTYIANGGNIVFNAGNTTGITTLSASATEENGGQIFNNDTGSDVNALAKLTSITATGALTIGGVAFTDSGSFSNAGSLTILSGESFNVGSLSQISSGKLTAGTYVLDANLNLTGTAQTITSNAATLTLAGGTIENTSNSTNALAGLSTNTGKLTIGGSSNTVSTTAASFSNTGTLTVNATDNFSAKNLAQLTGANTSKTLSAGTYVLAGNLKLTTTGIDITTNSANLTLEGGTIDSGSANALAGLSANTAQLTIAGSSKSFTTSAASFSNTGTLTVDKTDTFTAGNLAQISSGTLTAGTYVLAGNLDLTTSGISITTNSANLTLEGGTINSNGVSALSALAANTGNLTVAGTSIGVTTSAASFSNTGTLTIDTGDTFTAPALTQISGSTLTAGTYVLAGNLDLTASANITTNEANLTLEGGSIKTGTTNDLANLATNSGTLTLASNATFTAAGNFSNTGTLAINKGSTFTLTGTHTLTNLSGGTLSSGTYVIGGTLALTTTNGGITTNAANLTMNGTAAKINDGTTNALASFNNNTGSFTLEGSALLTSSTSSNFSNSGTIDVAKGSTFTVGGTGHNYNQTAGTSTVDGTLTATAINVTGGSVFGAGTLKGNTSVGNASGAAATLNVGDSGAAGLLAITGTYTQLATGAMNVSIGGLTTGTYSELTVSGKTTLGGTLTVAIVNGLVLTSGNIGTQFTILSSTGTLSGSFTNTTVTVGTDEFSISYVGNTVVLTLTSVTAAPSSGSKSSSSTPQAAVATSVSKRAIGGVRNNISLGSSLRHPVGGATVAAKPLVVAGMAPVSVHGPVNNLRTWEPISAPLVHTVRPVAVESAANVNGTGLNMPKSDLQMPQIHSISRTPVSGLVGTNSDRRPHVNMLPSMLPRMGR